MDRILLKRWQLARMYGAMPLDVYMREVLHLTEQEIAEIMETLQDEEEYHAQHS